MNDFKNWLQGYLEDKLEPQQIDKILQRLNEAVDTEQLLSLYCSYAPGVHYVHTPNLDVTYDYETVTKFTPNSIQKQALKIKENE